MIHSLLRKPYAFTIYFPDWQFIHYLVCEITINSLFFHDLIWNLLSWREFAIDQFSFLQIHYAFITFFAETLWIHYLFREFTIDSLSVTRIHYRHIIFFAHLLWIHYFSVNLLSVTQIHKEFVILSANSLWINLFFREFTIYLANSFEFIIHFSKSE